MIVVQVELAFEDEDSGDITRVVPEILEFARNSVTARVVGSYEQPGKYNDLMNRGWAAQAVDYITVTTPVKLRVDLEW